jgi:hypothetical protein
MVEEPPHAGLGLKSMPTPLGTFEGLRLTHPERPVLPGLMITWL